MNKIKIHVILCDLIKTLEYHTKIEKLIHHPQAPNQQDTINLTHVDYKEYPTTPFYVTFVVHDKLLHKCMLDYDASHNLMPKEIME